MNILCPPMCVYVEIVYWQETLWYWLHHFNNRELKKYMNNMLKYTYMYEVHTTLNVNPPNIQKIHFIRINPMYKYSFSIILHRLQSVYHSTHKVMLIILKLYISIKYPQLYQTLYQRSFGIILTDCEPYMYVQHTSTGVLITQTLLYSYGNQTTINYRLPR